MSRPLLSERQRAALQELVQLAGERARAEAETESGFKTRNEAIEAEFQQAQKKIHEVFTTTQAAAIKEFQDTTQSVSATFEKQHGAAAREFSAVRLKITSLFDRDMEQTEADFKESRWTIATVFEADKKVAKDQHVKLQRRVGTAIQRIEARQEAALALATQWQLADLCAGVTVPPLQGDAQEDPLGALKRCLTRVDEQALKLQQLQIPKILKGYRLAVLMTLLWLVLLLPALLMEEWYYWLAATTGAMVTSTLAVRAWLAATLRTQVIGLYVPLRQSVLAAEPLQKRCLEDGQAAYAAQMEQARKKHEEAVQQATRAYRQAVQDRTERRDRELRQAEEKYQPTLDSLTRQRDQQLHLAEDRYQRAMADSSTRYETDLQAATDWHGRLLEESKKTYVKEWQTLANNWKQGLVRFTAVMRAVNAECARDFPDWTGPAWNDWQPPTEVPGGLRFGTLQLSLDRIPIGVPRDERLRSAGPVAWTVPALLGFPERGSLLLKAKDEGRAEAVQCLQAVMLRALTAIPPSKVRFIIIDPVGRGENFAAFTHLADFDEALVTSRIWTEPGHIEQRLTDLTEHIENVIQKYLRNQFQTLEEYNAQAGEVAEPYRFLVIANFPVNFSTEAARRLVSIAASGARCGIQTLISVDTKQAPPPQFDPADLEQGSTILVWKDERFQWKDADFDRFPLRLEQPPAADFCTDLMKVVGEKARLASRVEVPFSLLAPPPEQWWTGDTRFGLRVPLGRAGATKKQYLQLGQGTSQHVLIAGKTGSGKSTMLHALITQLALLYSPDEVELYLVDFKKGVEFKTYAAHELPHARVVAIESEREFGLSVLQRLDAELKQRGDRFRALGVHDLGSYRQAVGSGQWAVGSGERSATVPGSEGKASASALPTAHCPLPTALPRVLLIVDEFQEFFVEDDKIAQEAALLLDRLVRQGRAFGIHILLGSQTLGGAYSLARSTIDQMAVRIALQCSEADGHLILSKENSAARLLSRPGEAIYNDANGLVEGNDLFQTVWLSDDRREECLRQVQELARQRPPAPHTQIIFEGNAPANLHKNPLLQRLLEAPDWPAPGKAYTAWLGEAIAIKDPTAAVFRRQSGANLLMVGQHGEAALSIWMASLLSLSAQRAPDADGQDVMRFYWLGDSSLDVPSDGVFPRLPAVVPHPLQVVGWREMPEVLTALAAEVDRRHKARDTEGAPLFLFLYGLQRFRDLRRPEDDFGFSRRGEEKVVPPSKQFVSIIREGPAVGVFTLLWCDTLTSVNRVLDRQALREFEMRVLFQMSAADSSNLIDSPAAAKVGLHRALFYTEDGGRLEKFRPYGYPTEAWLDWVKERFNRQAVAPPR